MKSIEKIYASWFTDFEPCVHASFLGFGSRNDWYDAKWAAQIEDACEVCWFNEDYSWKKAYFGAVSYRFHDEREAYSKDTCGRVEVAGPFLTEEEALAAAEEKFEETVATAFRY